MFNPFKPLGGAMGSIFGNKSKFNPMNAPGLKQVGNTLGMGQQQPQGIGPSQNAMGGFMSQMKGGQPPNQMNNMAQGMGNMASSMGMGGPKPPMETQQPPQMGAPMGQPPQMDGGWGLKTGTDIGLQGNYGGGLGPSMPAMQNMLQQPEQSQQPAAAGPMPDFMNRGQEQPLNRGYGRM